VIQFSDAPYRFFEAKPSPLVMSLGRLANRHLILPGPNHRIKEVMLEGATDEVREAKEKGERLMFVMNHPTHSDPQVVTEVHRMLGVGSSFMAAYDVFLRSRLTAWAMQHMGHFSIDREGSDRKAMSTAIQVLKDGERALNIFPEGNVFLMNDRVSPFLDGAAFIALKAQAALDGVPVKIVPMSMKFTHLTKPREAVTRRMLELGERSRYQFPKGSTQEPVSAVMGLGRHILAGYLKHHGCDEDLVYGGVPLYDALGQFAQRLMTGLEDALEIAEAAEAGLLDRIVKIRSRLHQLRTDRTAAPDPALDGLADRAILALRIHGYLTPYLTAHPTIDRYDETVERIAEDFHSKAMPRTGPRRVMVRVHQPVEVVNFISVAGGNTREAISRITREMQQSIQSGIDALNARNDAPGAMLVG
jgi:1-acyl-sn-glycerol-3-phosphate acyltransferase